MKKIRYKQHRGDRQPIYGDGKIKRIISAPNETWIAQVHVGSGTREKSPWEDISRPTTKAEALRTIGLSSIRLETGRPQ